MSLADNTRKFSVTCAKVSNTRSYPGGLVSFLVTSAETQDHFSLFEARMQPGNEPPLHLHEERDVVFYVLEGEMEVYCGNEPVRRKPATRSSCLGFFRTPIGCSRPRFASSL